MRDFLILILIVHLIVTLARERTYVVDDAEPTIGSSSAALIDGQPQITAGRVREVLADAEVLLGRKNRVLSERKLDLLERDATAVRQFCERAPEMMESERLAAMNGTGEFAMMNKWDTARSSRSGNTFATARCSGQRGYETRPVIPP